MIDYNNHDHAMEMMCDFCGDASMFYGTFPECIKEAREEGWQNYKNEHSEWHNKCPMCSLKKPVTEVFK